MNNKERRKIEIKRPEEVTTLKTVEKKDLLNDAELFDRDNYDPLKNLSEKEIIFPQKRTEIITIRLSQKENNQIRKLAEENGLSKSSFIRMLVKRSLKKAD
ncbi:plasmid mobilization protein [Candidatus Formimonas warabiya]|uniref:Uncharacterized protein n=1 Tax=Formimonas warabiya TaxID=1761012 RepID=A0A3G1KWV7_FORW1|nr:ribbon-helix-helix protein, CopG family [Candidatus Formimonas warabiya]ATW26936.1 hypothetical protein DCMF_21185 [Candidatus Formimonas warabiya]